MSLIFIENPSINMLHGYLICMATLCGPQFSFSAISFKDDREIDEFISELVLDWSAGDEYRAPSKYTYSGNEVIDYQAVRQEIARFVFNGELSGLHVESEGDASVGGMLLWRLFEYYGLASTCLNEGGVFHPQVKGPVRKLDIHNSEEARALYLLVNIEGMYVLTSFVERQAGQ